MARKWLVVICALLLGATTVQAAEDNQSPADVVDAFYTWYLDFIGTGDDFRNPLVERAYRGSDLLTESFVAEIDKLLASRQGAAYDPFLQAQDVPTWIQIGTVQIAEDGESAVVPAYTSFPAHVLAVTVVRDNGRWLIDDVARGTLATPEDVVNSFYARHLGYATPGSESFVNPMVARTYQNDPLLTEEFIAEIDALLDAWNAEYGGILADPFLCAQDVPTSFEVEAARYSRDKQTASVIMRTSLFNHAVTLDLIQRDDQWLIEGIRCGETVTPAG